MPNRIIVSDETQLLAALKAAIGDTEIRLKPGTYDRVILSNINPVGHVTIVSDSATNHAAFDVLRIDNSSNLEFRDLTFRHYATSSTLSSNQARLWGSHDISFIHDEFMGKVDRNYTNDGGGLEIDNSTRISVLDSKFHDLRWSLLTHESDHIVIAGNDVRKVREGFDFAGVHDVTIDRNLFTDFKPLLTGSKPDHPDAIQFWTTNSTASSRVEITNNAMLFGQHVPVQGIYIHSEQGIGVRHSDFTIDNNVYYGQALHGITLSVVDNSLVSNNTVITAPKVGNAQHLDASIRATNTTNVEISDNIASTMTRNGINVGLIENNNIDAWDARTGKGVSYASLFVKTITDKSPAADFVLKPAVDAALGDAGYDGIDRTGNWAAVDSVLIAKYHGWLDFAGHISSFA